MNTHIPDFMYDQGLDFGDQGILFCARQLLNIFFFQIWVQFVKILADKNLLKNSKNCRNEQICQEAFPDQQRNDLNDSRGCGQNEIDIGIDIIFLFRIYQTIFVRNKVATHYIKKIDDVIDPNISNIAGICYQNIQKRNQCQSKYSNDQRNYAIGALVIMHIRLNLFSVVLRNRFVEAEINRRSYPQFCKG